MTCISPIIILLYCKLPSTAPLNWGHDSQQNKLWTFFPMRDMIGSHQVFGCFVHQGILAITGLD